jgi:hypothetical protein
MKIISNHDEKLSSLKSNKSENKMNPSEIEDRILDILNKSNIVDELSIKILQSLIERIENFEDD